MIETKLDVVELSVHEEEVLVKVNQSVILPHSEIEQPYILELHIELNSLLETIWNSEPLDFDKVLNAAKIEHEKHFLDEVKLLVEECGNYAQLLHFSQEELHQKVYEFLLELLPKSLTITPKIHRKTTRIFVYNIHEQLIKKQRQELLARTIRDSGKSVCIIASSDFTHFGPNYGYVPFKQGAAAKVKKQDMEAIEMIKHADAEAFMNFITKISVIRLGKQELNQILHKKT